MSTAPCYTGKRGFFTVGMNKRQQFSPADPMVQIDKYLLTQELVFFPNLVDAHVKSSHPGTFHIIASFLSLTFLLFFKVSYTILVQNKLRASTT
jgi:hypothetical protein